MSPARRILIFSTLRIALFAIPFAALMLLRSPWWVAALVATVVGACLSYLFLDRQRSAVSETVYEWRNNAHTDADNDVENSALDRNPSS